MLLSTMLYAAKFFHNKNRCGLQADYNSYKKKNSNINTNNQ